MKKWVVKAIVQKVISFLPFSRQINYFFQKYVTKGVYLSDEYFFDRLEHAGAHLTAYSKYSEHTLPQSSLEIGTGWYPVVPISFFLSGVETIYSVDIEFLTSKKRVHTTMQRILDCYQNGNLENYLTILPNRLSQLREIYSTVNEIPLEKTFEKLHFKYLVQDARNLSLESNSIDLVNSNNTFEHIYPHLLQPILDDFKRVVNKQSGVMSHFIDMTDHFAHFDQRISVYNFLQFSDKQWKRVDNCLQPQSRLRIDDYKAIYQNLDIPITEESHRPGNMDELKNIQLDERFASKSDEINAISHCHFISKMKME